MGLFFTITTGDHPLIAQKKSPSEGELLNAIAFKEKFETLRH